MRADQWPVTAAPVPEAAGVPAPCIREILRAAGVDHQNGRWMLSRVGAASRDEKGRIPGGAISAHPVGLAMIVRLVQCSVEAVLECR